MACDVSPVAMFYLLFLFQWKKIDQIGIFATYRGRYILLIFEDFSWQSFYTLFSLKFSQLGSGISAVLTQRLQTIDLSPAWRLLLAQRSHQIACFGSFRPFSLPSKRMDRLQLIPQLVHRNSDPDPQR